jgi:hypothetical protein
LSLDPQDVENRRGFVGVRKKRVLASCDIVFAQTVLFAKAVPFFLVSIGPQNQPLFG